MITCCLDAGELLLQQFDVPIGFVLFRLVVFERHLIGVDRRILEAQINNIGTVYDERKGQTVFELPRKQQGSLRVIPPLANGK